MKSRIVIKPVVLIAMFIYLLVPTKLFAEWAYLFVVYDGYTYVISDEFTTEIDKKIGKVTKYSDRAGTYYGNFSNKYKKGTRYYSIRGTRIEEAIAVEENGKYRVAFRKDEYAGWKYNPFNLALGGLVILIIAILLLKLRKKLIRK